MSTVTVVALEASDAAGLLPPHPDLLINLANVQRDQGKIDEAMAIAVKKPKRYAKPKDLEDVSGSPTPPQSFQ